MPLFLEKGQEGECWSRLLEGYKILSNSRRGEWRGTHGEGEMKDWQYLPPSWFGLLVGIQLGSRQGSIVPIEAGSLEIELHRREALMEWRSIDEDHFKSQIIISGIFMVQSKPA